MQFYDTILSNRLTDNLSTNQRPHKQHCKNAKTNATMAINR